MSFYPGSFPVTVDFTGGLEIGGVAVTSSAAELNLADNAYQLLVADGAIAVKNGVCVIAKTVAGVVAATLADPTDVTDNFKRLTIISGQAQANTVTSASSFGGGGAGEDVATFSGQIGDTLNLLAYGGKWYITGTHQCTIA
ncbi:hypothetical protein [Caldilinea sp.]|uniref:hypothetical protein n=1 Tax=Caldilinea sp. TaxID=2293560 RepID=UPI002B573318|nr:hypothetical protein [Caldilinea sp.]